MPNNAFFQEVFSNFESCYINKLSIWDKESYIEALSRLNQSEILQLLKTIADQRGPRDLYLPVPNVLRKKTLELFPIKPIEVPEKNYDDCKRCYNDGYILCKKNNTGEFEDVNAYQDIFLCTCNNAEKAHQDYPQWNDSLREYYLPVNYLIKQNFNGSYKEFMDYRLKKIFNYSQKQLSLESQQKLDNVLDRTEFKKMKFEINQENLKTDKKSLAN